MIIHWFRRDLRLTDNTALNAAVMDSAGLVIPVFIQSQWKDHHPWVDAPRLEFLCGSLRDLAEALAKAGARLIVRRGAVEAELEKLVRETGARAIYFNRDPDPFGRKLEQRVVILAKRLGVEAKGFHDVTVHCHDAVWTGAGTPFRVFTPYSKAWRKLAVPPPGKRVTRFSWQHSQQRNLLAALASNRLPSLQDWNLTSSAKIQEPGETAARNLLRRFFAGPVFEYGVLRDMPSLPATSRFSAALRWGLLSPRELIECCKAASAEAETAEKRKSVQRFLDELIWREFYMAILWHYPDVLKHEFYPQFRGLPWLYPGEPKPGIFADFPLTPADAFQRWCEGMTGFPIVDAGMRQLTATGFMHNRVRMITAMFLTKDLHIDWRLGEQFFMRKLTDGEVASNNGGWQWSAGTGADAAPYFRIQNPWSQTARFDPEGKYIKQWLPELRSVPANALASPPPPGTLLTKHYPAPMVDHSRERELTLDVFRSSNRRMKPAKGE